MKELVIVKEGEWTDIEGPWRKRAEKTMSAFHPNRLREWVNGRVALTLAFQKFGITIGPDDEFEGYQKLRSVPGFIFSISHTEGMAGALLIQGDQCPGLDIERKNRKVTAAIAERFAHPGDEDLDLLLLWSAKEAAYKTLPAEIQEKIWLQSIQVGQGIFSGEGFSGTWEKKAHPELLIVEALRLC